MEVWQIIQESETQVPTAKVLKVAHNASTIDLMETLKASLKVSSKSSSKKHRDEVAPGVKFLLTEKGC